MPEQQSFNTLLTDPNLQLAAQAAGPLPAIPAPTVAQAYLTYDADAIAAKALNFSGSLTTRQDVLALLKRIQVRKRDPEGKPIDPTTPDATTAGSIPLVGPNNAIYVAASLLSQQASLLSGIKPFDPCATEGCGIDKLVSLVQSDISDVVKAVSVPGEPQRRVIDLTLRMLTGFEPRTCKPFTFHSACGHIGDLRDLGGFTLRNACTPEQERTLTTFRTVTLLSWMLVQAWQAECHSWDGSDYLGVTIYDIRRYLYALTVNLKRLWNLITPAEWATTQLPVHPPIYAGVFWKWMYDFVTQKALAMIEGNGKQSLGAISVVLNEFQSVLREGFLAEVSRKTDSVDCNRLPRSFTCEEVREVVQEMLCQAQKVEEIVSHVNVKAGPPPEKGSRKTKTD